MTPIAILFIFIVIVLIVWWALLRNAHKYQPGFEVHHQEEHTGHGETETKTASVEEVEIAPIEELEAAPVEETAVVAAAAVMDPQATADEPLGFASAETKEAFVEISRPEAAIPMEEAEEALGFATPEPQEAAAPAAVTEAAVVAEAVAEAAAAPDDLTILEGVGPKAAQVLASAGITTFAQLANADPAFLRKTLNEAGLRILDPGTWPEQASLAAAGKMDEFQQLTSALKGGRRVQ